MHRREQVKSHNTGHDRETETSRRKPVGTSHHRELVMMIFALGLNPVML